MKVVKNDGKTIAAQRVLDTDRPVRVAEQLAKDEFPVGQWIPLLEDSKQLADWTRMGSGDPPKVEDGTVALEVKWDPEYPLRANVLRREITTPLTRYMFHVRHARLEGFGISEGLVFETGGFGVSLFSKNSL